MRPADFDVHELIGALQGTCDTIPDHLPEGMEEEDLTQEDHNTIDNEIFLCEVCGWWCEISEQVAELDGTCQDCYDAEE